MAKPCGTHQREHGFVSQRETETVGFSFGFPLKVRKGAPTGADSERPMPGSFQSAGMRLTKSRGGFLHEPRSKICTLAPPAQTADIAGLLSYTCRFCPVELSHWKFPLELSRWIFLLDMSPFYFPLEFCLCHFLLDFSLWSSFFLSLDFSLWSFPFGLAHLELSLWQFLIGSLPLQVSHWMCPFAFVLFLIDIFSPGNCPFGNFPLEFAIAGLALELSLWNWPFEHFVFGKAYVQDQRLLTRALFCICSSKRTVRLSAMNILRLLAINMLTLYATRILRCFCHYVFLFRL